MYGLFDGVATTIEEVIITIWECELKPARREATLKSLAFTLNSIFLDNLQVKRYDFSDSAPSMVADDARF